MKNLLTPEQLIAFEDDIANCFTNKLIRAPIHLDFGNEEQMIETFRNVEPDDWCCGTWRTHYVCLLKGVPQDELKQAILDGRSISLCFKKQKIVSSAIVGGIIPIALGIALAIKQKQEKNKVWCFVGDMSATTGLFHEALYYAQYNDLPITFVVTDNGKSVCTDTRNAWGTHRLPFEVKEVLYLDQNEIYKTKHLWYYKFENTKYPHAGPGGARIQF